MAIKTITKPAGAKNTPVKTAAAPAAAKTAPSALKATPIKNGTSSNGAKKTSAKPVTAKTVIIAKVNVGWGNSLYLRGQGGGLSWDVGLQMDCEKRDEWQWSCPAGAGPLTFKFVRNDLHWELGENHVVLAGATGVFTPQFPPWTT
jgi:hypothetical protein